MNVNTMRKVDHWVGVPLTFLATFWVKLWDLFRSKAAAKPERILLIELSEMGSTIIADPAMQKLQSDFDAELFFVIFSKNKVSLDLLKPIKEENIFLMNEDNLFTLIASAFKYLWWCRKNKIDTTVDLELFSRVSALLGGLSGATNRVGFHNFRGEGLYRGGMLTHKVAYNPHIHIAKNFMALVHALGCEEDEVPYSKIIIPEDSIKIRQVTFTADQIQPVLDKVVALAPEYDANQDHIVLINPNASDLLPQRKWPRENFIALAQRVMDANDNVFVLITGAPAEFDQAEQIRLAVDRDRIVNFAGQLKLTEMPILYTISRLMVTNDSGPGHFSSITPLKTFVLFGPETPALYGSLGNSTSVFAGLACSPCVSAANHRNTPCTQPVCMTAITVDQVTQLVQTELDT